MPKYVNIETELNANFPGEKEFLEFGGLFVLKVNTAQILVSHGCNPDTITFGGHWFDDEKQVWKIRGKGVLENGS